MNERDMLNLLHKRYAQINMGNTPRYLIAEQPNYRTLARADAVVLDRNWTYDYQREKGDPQRGYQAVHGFEIKCTRNDWLRERNDPLKAELWKRYCHHWWLVAPSTDIVKPDEVPEGWGLLVPRGGPLAIKVHAPFTLPRPLSHEATLSLALAIARTAVRTGSVR